MTFLSVHDLHFLFNDDRALLVGERLGDLPALDDWMDLRVDGKLHARLHFAGVALELGERLFVAAREAIPLERKIATSAQVELTRLTDSQREAADYAVNSGGAWIVCQTPEGLLPARIEGSQTVPVAEHIDETALLEHLSVVGIPTVSQIRRV